MIPLEEIENHPNFPKLPYEKQAELRKMWLDASLMDLPQQVDPALYQQMVQKAVFKPPKLEGNLSSYGQDRLQLLQKIEAGDKRELFGTLFGETWMGSLGLVRLLGYGVESLLRGDADKSSYMFQVPKPQTSDDEKVSQYLLNRVLADPDLKSTAKTAQILGTITGNLTDYVLGRIALGPLMPPTIQGVQKLLGEGITKTAFGRWVFSSAVPELMRSSRDATILTTSQALQMVLNEDPQTPDSLGRWAAWGVTAFGSNLVADYLVFAGWSLLRKTTGTALKAFRGSIKDPVERGIEVLTENLKEASESQLIRGMVAGTDIDPTVLASLPEETRKTFVRMQARFQSLKNLGENVPVTREQTFDMLLMAKGFDFVQEEGKAYGKLINIATGEQVGKQFYASAEDALRTVFSKELKKLGKTAVQETVVAETPNVRIRSLVELPTSDADKLLITGNIHKALGWNPLTGEYQLDSFKTYLTEALGKKSVAFEVVEDYFDRKATELDTLKDKILLPKTIEKEKMGSFLARFSRNILAVGEGKGFIPNQVLREVKALENAVSLFDPRYAEPLVRKVIPDATVQVQGQKIVVAGPDGVKLTFPDQRSFTRWAFQSVSTPQTEGLLQTYLKKQLGIDLDKNTTTNLYTLRQRGKILFQAADMGELFDELYNRGWLPGLPEEFAPQLVVVTKKADQMILSARGDAVVGTPDHLASFLEKYKNYGTKSTERAIQQIKGLVNVSEVPQVGYQVDVLDANFSRTFTDKKELLEFLRGISKEQDKLLTIGRMKGLFIYRGGDTIYVRTPGGEVKHARNLGELKEIIRTTPNLPEVGRELTGLDDQFIKEIFHGYEDLLGEMQGVKATLTDKFNDFDIEKLMKESPQFKKLSKEASWTTSALGLFGSMDRTIQEVSKTLNNPEIYKRWWEFRKAATTADGLARKSHAVVRRILSDLTEEELKNGIHLMETHPSKWAEVAKSFGFELTPALEKAAKNLRTVYQELGQLFGVDPTIMQTQYMPRIRQFLLENRDKLDPTEYVLKSLGSEFPGQLPLEIRFFAKNMRTQELIRWVESADMAEVTYRYIRSGYRSLLIDPVYKPFREIVNEVAKADLNYGQRLIRYSEQILGSDIDLEGAFLKKMSLQASTEFFQQLSKITGSPALSKKEINDILGLLNGLVVGSTMAFRPAPVIRNILQTYFTLGTRIGFAPVTRAIQRVLNESIDDVAKVLNELGETLEVAPSLQSVQGTKFADYLMKWGMKPYKTADTLNRIITYYAVEDVFGDAVAKWVKEGGRLINEKHFMNLSGLRVLDPTDQLNILQMLKTKGPDAAKLEFVRKMIYETQFPYSSAENPMIFHGLWGRLFGGFGTYSAFYIQNLLRGIKNAGIPGAAAFVGRTAAVSAAAYLAFEKLLKIPATAFMPWGQALFTGSPLFNLFHQTLQATQPGYKGDISRSDLLTQWGRLLVPGGVQMKAIQGALEAADRGDTYEALVRALGFAYVTD